MVEKEFTEGIRSIIENCRLHYNNGCKALSWETLKAEMRGFCIAYGTIRKRELIEETKHLEEELGILEELIINNDILAENYAITKMRLRELEKRKLNGIILRGKSKVVGGTEEIDKMVKEGEKRNIKSKEKRTLEVN